MPRVRSITLNVGDVQQLDAAMLLVITSLGDLAEVVRVMTPEGKAEVWARNVVTRDMSAKLQEIRDFIAELEPS